MNIECSICGSKIHKWKISQHNQTNIHLKAKFEKENQKLKEKIKDLERR